MRRQLLLACLTLAPGCSKPGSSGPSATTADDAVAWTSGGVRFTQRTVHYPSLNAGMTAQPEGSIDALVAEPPADPTVLVEITAAPAHGAGFPWTFETTFTGGAVQRWECSPQGQGQACRALINALGATGPAKTRLAATAPPVH
jgi:hypothetical protein